MACDAGFIVALLLLFVFSVHSQDQSNQSLSASGQAWQGGDPPPTTTSQAWSGDSPPPLVTNQARQDDGLRPWVTDQGPDNQSWQGSQSGEINGGQPDGLTSWVQAQTISTTMTFTITSPSPTTSATEFNILTTTPTPSTSTSPSTTDALTSYRQSQLGTANPPTAPTSNRSRKNIIIILSVALPLTLIVIGIVIAVMISDRRYQRRLSIFPRRQQAILDDHEKAGTLKGVMNDGYSQSILRPQYQGTYGLGIQQQQQQQQQQQDILPVPPILQTFYTPRRTRQEAMLEPDPFADPPEWRNFAFGSSSRKQSMRSSLAVEISTPSTSSLREESDGNRAMWPRSWVTRKKVTDSFARRI